MSYCRWSSDCYQSDVYVYEGYDAFVINIAKIRYVSDQPRPIEPPITDVKAWLAYWDATREWVRNANQQIIGLPYDGMTFYCNTSDECASFLRELKAMGYSIPQYAIALLEEADDSISTV
jgi:hypothetical protein